MMSHVFVSQLQLAWLCRDHRVYVSHSTQIFGGFVFADISYFLFYEKKFVLMRIITFSQELSMACLSLALNLSSCTSTRGKLITFRYAEHQSMLQRWRELGGVFHALDDHKDTLAHIARGQVQARVSAACITGDAIVAGYDDGTVKYDATSACLSVSLCCCPSFSFSEYHTYTQ
jgi:hypothetical protein